MKVLTFSKKFPKFHPKYGKATFFPEKILQFVYFKGKKKCKSYTIREGNRWKVGEWFSARFWTGRPYRSPQQEFANLQIKKIWKIVIDRDGTIWIDDYLWSGTYDYIASNDGLNNRDFIDWIVRPNKRKKKFKGQIICWNEKIYFNGR